MTRSIEILGCRLDDVGAAEASQRVIAAAAGGTPVHVVTLGTEMVVHAQSDERYRRVINASALCVCDTVGLLTVARARGAELRERVTGVELIELLCAQAAQKNISIYLLGGSPGVAQKAASKLQRRHPGLRIAGSRDGYFREEESPEIAAAIKQSGAQMLFVGMGFPRQELWLHEYLAQTGCGAGIGVGGSFDVISGKVERAPRIWQRLGLEWLYRLVTQPHRWRRQLALPRFVLFVLAENLGLRPRKGVIR